MNIPHSTRESNFELLRILAMLMIVASHYAVHGIGFDNWMAGTFVNRCLIVIFYPCGEIGVALFFMLSGYFLILKDRVSVKKVFLTTVFYALISVLFYIFSIGIKSLLDIVHIARFMLIPVTSGNWWFVTVYVILVLFAPYINVFLRKMNRRQYLLILCVSWLFLYVLGAFYRVLFASLQKAFLFYCIGAFFRLYPKIDRKKIYIYLKFLCSTFFTVFFSYKFLKSYTPSAQNTTQEFYRICVTGFCVPACAVFLFLIFQKLKLAPNHIINEIAACTFGVYLFHDSPFNRKLIWGGVLMTEKQFSSQLCPLLALASIFSVFILGVLIEKIRMQFFEHFAVRLADSVLERFWR